MRPPGWWTARQEFPAGRGKGGWCSGLASWCGVVSGAVDACPSSRLDPVPQPVDRAKSCVRGYAASCDHRNPQEAVTPRVAIWSDPDTETWLEVPTTCPRTGRHYLQDVSTGIGLVVTGASRGSASSRRCGSRAPGARSCLPLAAHAMESPGPLVPRPCIALGGHRACHRVASASVSNHPWLARLVASHSCRRTSRCTCHKTRY
jgi:hypothetical protein